MSGYTGPQRGRGGSWDRPVRISHLTFPPGSRTTYDLVRNGLRKVQNPETSLFIRRRLRKVLREMRFVQERDGDIKDKPRGLPETASWLVVNITI